MKSFLTIILSFIAITLFSQSWIDIRDHGGSFFEVQEAFNSEWQGREYEKGKGYKQYKRWEYFMRPRVDSEGYLPPADHILKEYNKFIKQYDIAKKGMDSNRDNSTWTFSGPYDISSNPGGKGIGRVNVVAVDPNNSSIIFVGTAGGGLWKSTNNGNSWMPLTDDLPVFGVTGIAINPLNSDVIYIGTGDANDSDSFSMGVLKSTDGGQSWQTTNIEYDNYDSRKIYDVVLSPNDPNTVFCGASTGLFKSVNAGENWYKVASGKVFDIEFHPTNPDVMYYCSPAMYRSTDGGENFSVVNSGLPSTAVVSRSCIAVSPDEPNWVYLLAGSSMGQGLLGVYRSTDAAQSFSQRADDSPNLMGWSSDGSDSGGQAWYDIALAVNPDNAQQIYVGGVNQWRSNNGGSTWDQVAHWTSGFTDYVHADIHDLVFFDGTIYCASDGGVFRSFNLGNSWQNISNGLGITQVYGIGTSDQIPGNITLGAQDNGSAIKSGGQWSRMYGGDGMQTHISPNDPSRVYCATQNGNLFLSNNGGSDFMYYSSDVDEDGGWLTPYELSVTDPNKVIAGFENVWYYSNGNWSQLSDFHTQTIDNIALSPSNSNHIYFSRYTKLYKTSDFGDNWDDITTGLPINHISGIEVRPNDEDEVYTCFSGYGGGEKVFRSLDGGQTWENQTFNLPNVSVNCLAMDDESGVYIGTELGVFYKNDNLSNWQYYSEDLPLVSVRDLDILQNNNMIKAATYGRGVWESQLYTVVAEAPLSDFSVSKQTICSGESIVFSDLSVNADAQWNWSFEGGVPASSNLASPEVTYTQGGVYQVSLNMSNSFGSDVEVKSGYIVVLDSDLESVPFLEDFESSDVLIQDKWILVNEDENNTWEVSQDVGYQSDRSVVLNNNISSIGDIDELLSSTYDLSGLQDVKLSFWYAYAQRNENNKDKLKLYFSKNCGDNWTFKENFNATSDLSTADITSSFFEPDNTQWQYFEINIGEIYLGPDFRFRFKFKNDGGNALYIDDINIESVTGIDDDAIDNSIFVYPNPVREIMHIKPLEEGETYISVYDLLGELVFEKTVLVSDISSDILIPVSFLSNGLFLLNVISDSGLRTVKVLVE